MIHEIHIFDVYWSKKRLGLVREKFKSFDIDHKEKAQKWMDKRAKKKKHVKFIIYVDGRRVEKL